MLSWRRRYPRTTAQAGYARVVPYLQVSKYSQMHKPQYVVTERSTRAVYRIVWIERGCKSAGEKVRRAKWGRD